MTLGLERDIVDATVYERTVKQCADTGVVLPTFAQLARPATIPAATVAALDAVDPDAPHALNLFRVHWYNGSSRRARAAVPDHLVLPPSLTGVPAPIIVALGDRFPMIRAHKVLAAYACLAPRLVTGQFDPTVHKAVWPSTGNYCRGGVAISRIMGCRGVAVLPEGMSAERFHWLERWVSDPGDIVRTPGTESNVKEIYDECAALQRDPQNVIFNQFCEFGNYLAHLACTGPALADVFEVHQQANPRLRLRAFVSATGSAGTIGAGDHLKDVYGAHIVAVEALECPTLLYNGFGEHNIQGIGDKHVPLIHNVMNTDLVCAVSDRATDRLSVLFGSEVGRQYLVHRRHVPRDIVAGLESVGLSGICNVLAAIKVAKYFGYGPDDAVVTIATDGADLYRTEEEKARQRYFAGQFDAVHAGETYGEHLLGATVDHVLEPTARDRERIFNLGYYTWVEQQGVPVEAFTARRQQAFWRSLRDLLPVWDGLIDEFNARVGAQQPVS